MTPDNKVKDINLTTSVNIEVTIKDNKYIFSIPAGSPFGETYDALIKTFGIVKEWLDKSHEKIKNAEPKADTKKPKVDAKKPKVASK